MAPWHLDEHIPDFPVPVDTVATIGPPLPDGTVPSRVTVLQRAVADAVAGATRSDIVLAGARDLDPAERDALAASQVRRIPAAADAFPAALSPLRDLPIYLHVNVDILDSTEVPGLRFPTGSGPALADIEDCLTVITATADVVAASLACAWLPGQVGSPPARQAIARLAGALGARLTWAPGDMQAATTA